MVKPGELRILKALSKGEPLGNVELADPAEIKNSTVRSRYLRNLRKMGLITKDIDTHKYKLIARGWEMLYLTDILSLMQDRVDLAASMGLEDAGIGMWQFEFVISEDPSIPRLVNDLLTGGSEEGLETRLALSKVLNLVDDVWRRRSLEAFSFEERKVIEDYMEKLSDASWLLYGDGEEGQQTAIMMRRRRMLSSLCPDVEALKKAFESTERNITDSTLAELNEIISNLEEPGKIKLYKQYLERVRACPKSLIVSPSSAFRDYLKRYLELFPEKKEAMAGMKRR